MPFIKVNRAMAGLFPHWGPSREPETRTYPERVILPVAKGVVPTGNPPVRIFLGTEPAQHRAERVFVWSVRQARDPARQYEIYLMKDLAGFGRSRWTTGFTNYRFAIPHFAQGSGRAIYNDVDQVYLVDPAELFDLDMGDHGFLAISDTESSVMLIDCARMAQIWSLEDACRLSKKRLLTRAVAVPGLRGPLSPDWNARDAEYEAGRSKLLHYTTLHTQPWRPFPDQFAYQEHPMRSCGYPWNVERMRQVLTPLPENFRAGGTNSGSRCSAVCAWKAHLRRGTGRQRGGNLPLLLHGSTGRLLHPSSSRHRRGRFSSMAPAWARTSAFHVIKRSGTFCPRVPLGRIFGSQSMIPF